MIYENMHYITYIINQFIKATKKSVTKSIFYKCWIVVVTCVVILIYMHRIDSDPCANSKVFNYFPQHGECTQVCHFRAEVRRLLRLTVQLVPTALWSV